MLSRAGFLATASVALSFLPIPLLLLVDIFKSQNPVFPATPLLWSGASCIFWGPPLSQISGLYRFKNFKLFQPWQGGARFVTQQAVGWFLQSVALCGCFAFIHYDVATIRFHGLVTFVSVIGTLANAIVFSSLGHFQGDAVSDKDSVLPRSRSIVQGLLMDDAKVVHLCGWIALLMFMLCDFPLHGGYGSYEWLSNSAVLLSVIGMFIAHYNGMCRYPGAYQLWQPFRGGFKFVVLQGVAWFFMASMLYLYIGRASLLFSAKGSLTAIGVVFYIAEVLLLIALQKFKPGARMDRAMYTYMQWTEERLCCLLMSIFGFAMCVGVEVAAAWGPSLPSKAYVHGLPCAILLHLAPPLTQHLGRPKDSTLSEFWQPFEGGTTFATIQALAWALYALSLTLMMLFLLNDITQSLWIIAAIGFLSEILVLASLPTWVQTKGSSLRSFSAVEAAFLTSVTPAILAMAGFCLVDCKGGNLFFPDMQLLAIASGLTALCAPLAQAVGLFKLGVPGNFFSLSRLQYRGPEFEALQIVGWTFYSCMVAIHGILVVNFDGIKETMSIQHFIVMSGIIGLIPWCLILGSIACYRAPHKKVTVHISRNSILPDKQILEPAISELANLIDIAEDPALREMLESLHKELYISANMKPLQGQDPACQPLSPSSLSSSYRSSTDFTDESGMAAFSSLFFSAVSLGFYLLADALCFVLNGAHAHIPTMLVMLGLGLGTAAILLIQLVGGPSRHKSFKAWQPFIGGYRFVMLQSFGWALFSISVFMALMALATSVSTAMRGLLGATGVAGCAGQILIFMSIPCFEKDKDIEDLAKWGPDSFMRKNANEILSLLLTITAISVYCVGELMFNHYHVFSVMPLVIFASLTACVAVQMAYLSRLPERRGSPGRSSFSRVDLDAFENLTPAEIEDGIQIKTGDAISLALSIISFIVCIVVIYWGFAEIIDQSRVPIRTVATVCTIVGTLPIIYKVYDTQSLSVTMFVDVFALLLTTSIFLLPQAIIVSVGGVGPIWGTIGSLYCGLTLTIHTFQWVTLPVGRVIGYTLIVYALYHWNLDCLVWTLITLWYLSGYNDDHLTGKRAREGWMKHTGTWDWIARFFSFRVISHGKLDPKRQYFACFHPHGVYAATAFWGPRTSEWRKHYPDLWFSTHVATIIFRTPFLRDLMMLSGLREVSRKGLDYTLKEGSGIIVPGGQAEMLLSESNSSEVKVLIKHKGFIRIALEYGVDLVPMFCFNETGMMDIVKVPAMQEWFNQKARFAYPHIAYGRGYLPFPHNVPITMVVGDPIPVEKTIGATQDQVDALHKIYFDKLRQLYELYKGECGFGHVKLVYVDK